MEEITVTLPDIFVRDANAYNAIHYYFRADDQYVVVEYNMPGMSSLVSRGNFVGGFYESVEEVESEFEHWYEVERSVAIEDGPDPDVVKDLFDKVIFK